MSIEVDPIVSEIKYSREMGIQKWRLWNKRIMDEHEKYTGIDSKVMDNWLRYEMRHYIEFLQAHPTKYHQWEFADRPGQGRKRCRACGKFGHKAKPVYEVSGVKVWLCPMVSPVHSRRDRLPQWRREIMASGRQLRAIQNDRLYAERQVV